MKKFLRFVPFFFLHALLCSGAFAQEANVYGKSLAIILKVSGDEKIIHKVEQYKTNVFDGKSKNIYGRSSVKSSSPLHIQVFSGQRELLIDAYFDNPLDLQLESFQPDGTIERGKVESQEGFVNLRLPLPQSAGTLTLVASQINQEGAEHPVSTIQIAYDEK